MELKIEFRIGEDNRFFYVFDQYQNLLSSYSKEQFKSVEEVKKHIKELNDKSIKDIMNSVKEIEFGKNGFRS